MNVYSMFFRHIKKIFVPLVAIFMILLKGADANCQSRRYAGSDYLHRLAENRTEGKTNFYKFISGTAAPVSLGTPLVYFIAGAVTKKNSLKNDALFSLESLLLTYGATFSMKYIINKPRPGEADSTLVTLKDATNGAFPSGHTSEAFSTATTLTLLTRKWYVALPAYTWAGLVGFSRMYMGVHYPIDVFAGALTGIGCSLLAYQANKWFQKKKEESKKEIVWVIY